MLLLRLRGRCGLHARAATHPAAITLPSTTGATAALALHVHPRALDLTAGR